VTHRGLRHKKVSTYNPHYHAVNIVKFKNPLAHIRYVPLSIKING